MTKKTNLTLKLWRDHRSQYRWTLIGRNGRKLANGGESYKNKAGLKKDIFLVFGDFLYSRPDLVLDDKLDLLKSEALDAATVNSVVDKVVICEDE